MNIQSLQQYLSYATCAFTAVKAITEILMDQGYTELKWQEKWELKSGQGYYVTIRDSSLIAFYLILTPFD